MPPARTGTVDRNRRADGSAYYRARIRLADGARIRVDVPTKYSYSEERAELYAAAVQEREDETGELLGKKREREANEAMQCDESAENTCDAYFKRFLEHRSSMGRVRRARDLESAWTVWISPKIGSKPMAGDNRVNRGDVEDVRDALDMAVAQRKRGGGRTGLSGARARNVWSVLTSMMKEACTSKRRDLRVRDDNPCSTVQPPEKTDPRAKTFVYPNEFLKLVSCAEVPRDWRELYAVACYLYLRPGELRSLLWTDVDFEAGVVHVTKAYDEDSKTVKAPKTRNGVRDVPIPSALQPLLKGMHDRFASKSASVLPLLQELNENRRAGWMRQHLKVAKVERARLSEESSTTMQINFRSWRDTGITWLALQGLDVAKIQRRAGHDSISTTLGYVKMAEDLTGSIGQPFPPLPEALVGKGMGAGRTPTSAPKLNGSKPPSGKADQAKDWAKRSVKNSTRMNLHVNTVGEAGFEPATTSTQSSCTTGLCDSPENDGPLASRSPCAYGAGGVTPSDGTWKG